MLEYRVSGENSLLVYKNGKLIDEFQPEEHNMDFNQLEKPEIEDFLEEQYGKYCFLAI